jgi:hypothetical protein
MKTLAALLLTSTAAFAQVTPLPADRVADFVGINFHTDIFQPCPNQIVGNPGGVYCDPTATFQGINILFNELLDSHIRYVRVGGNAPSGDGGTHIAADFARKKRLSDAGLKLDVVVPQCFYATTCDQTQKQQQIEYDCSQYTCWQAEGLNEPIAGCPTIAQDQQILWNIIRNDTNPYINTLPIIGPSLLPGTCNGITFNGDVNFGNVHPYIHEVNPDHNGWLHGYYSLYQKMFPNPAGGYMPLVATEFGWTTAWLQPNYIIARYEPRGILEMIQIGYDKGYRHQIADDCRVSWGYMNCGYGMIDYLGAPKPQWIALKNLIHTFEDPTPFTPTPIPLNITHVSGLNPAPCPMPCTNQQQYGNRQSMLFQKSTGEYLLALWQGTQAYSAETAVSITQLVAGQGYTITRTGNSNWLAVGSPSDKNGTPFTATGHGTGTGTASAVTFVTKLVKGHKYMVAATGTTTDWTAVGVPKELGSNNQGTVFTATGPGTGDGLVQPYAEIAYVNETVRVSSGTTATSVLVTEFTDTGALATHTIPATAGQFTATVTGNLKLFEFK